MTGTPTSITFTGSSGFLGVGVTGSIKDLPPGSLNDFMTFTGNPDLHFDLQGIGPGPGNTNCAALAPFESCAAFAGSAFALTLAADGVQTTVSLRAFGIVTDTTGAANWNGSFSVTIPDLTPAQIQALINGGGSITSTDSGSFTLTAIPEPATVAMTGMALMALGLARRRRLQ